MTEKIGYQCKECGRTEIVTDGSVPECCGKPMKEAPLEVCMKPPADAESARMTDDDEACDDSRGG
ncbi:MAG: hypothetical protein KGY65_01895 [Candidatus Thermoplasmatota archaeon]|nr:hypothetical protein [Candidatus Thermoplasmatota archaeon]